MSLNQEIITAISTPSGKGAIAVVRISGEGSIELVQSIFKGKDLTRQQSHTIHYGRIVDGQEVLDEVMVSIFRKPKSFTTEDLVEVSCHGSPFVAEKIIQLLLKKGARLANPGEFTLRAFINGRIDLSQAEAIADLIASSSAAAHAVAMKQMRGGFSHEIINLRTELLNFASLLELELDFSEEDVEFANREKLVSLIDNIRKKISPLIESFQLGNVIKAGVNTVIAGKPNAGKSTLLNALLNEERAIVSAIAGTTRDVIEETINIRGLVFRFMDTAGLRHTEDEIEKIGVQKSHEKIRDAAVLIYLADASSFTDMNSLNEELSEAKKFGVPFLLVLNKTDLLNENLKQEMMKSKSAILISAKSKTGIDELKDALFHLIAKDGWMEDQTIVTNLRHFESLKKANEALSTVKFGIEKRSSGEMIAFDLRASLDALGEISGEVTNDEVLGNIFSKFCIGK